MTFPVWHFAIECGPAERALSVNAYKNIPQLLFVLRVEKTKQTFGYAAVLTALLNFYMRVCVFLCVKASIKILTGTEYPPRLMDSLNSVGIWLDPI